MQKNNLLIGCTLAAALFATAVIAAPGPLPQYWGEAYDYYDAQGRQVGHAEITCQGEFRRSGTVTGYFTYIQKTCG